MSKLIPWLLMSFLALSPVAALATNGYYTHGKGTKNKAMAGSGIAMPEDAIDLVTNPAATTEVGDQFIIGAALFSPIRKYQTSPSQLNGQFGSFTIGPNALTSDSEYFVIPHLARSWQLSNGNAWGLAFYGRGGMNTTWKGGTATFDPDGPGPAPVMTLPGTFGGGKAGVDLSQAFLDINWARKVNDQFSFGLTAIISAQVFEAKGVSTFAGFTETFAASGGTVFPQNLSDNGHDWSYGIGLKGGLLFKPSDRVSIGLAYQTKINMSEFDDYADLFAEQGDFDIPANIQAGITFRASDAITLNFDIEHTWFSDVDAVGNSISRLFACPTAGQGGTSLPNCLGGDEGGGFGWDDMTVFKLGLAYVAGQDWTWRLGYSYGDQPIPESEMTFNILAPAVQKHHISAGFSLRRVANRELNVAVMYSPNEEVTGPQNFDPTQTVTFEMHQWEAEVSYSWRF